MGIRDRDYLKGWRPEDADVPPNRPPRTWRAWLGPGLLLLLVAAIVAVALAPTR